MSDDEKSEEQPKAKKGKMKKLIVGLVAILILGGGGAAGGFFVAGTMQHDGVEAEDPNMPKLVSKDGSEVPKAVSHEKGEPQKAKFDQSAFKATYYPIETPFTSNLKGSSSFAQMSLAIATYYDERVQENIVEHETAIRSAVLMTMAEQDSVSLGTQQGKETLQGLLTATINKVLKQKTGFGGVDNVYFTSFVVQ